MDTLGAGTRGRGVARSPGHLGCSALPTLGCLAFTASGIVGCLTPAIPGARSSYNQEGASPEYSGCRPPNAWVLTPPLGCHSECPPPPPPGCHLGCQETLPRVLGWSADACVHVGLPLYPCPPNSSLCYKYLFFSSKLGLAKIFETLERGLILVPPSWRIKTSLDRRIPIIGSSRPRKVEGSL